MGERWALASDGIRIMSVHPHLHSVTQSTLGGKGCPPRASDVEVAAADGLCVDRKEGRSRDRLRRRRRAESGAGGLHSSRKWTPILRLDRRRRRKEEGKGGEEPTIVIQSRLPCRADLQSFCPFFATHIDALCAVWATH